MLMMTRIVLVCSINEADVNSDDNEGGLYCRSSLYMLLELTSIQL